MTRLRCPEVRPNFSEETANLTQIWPKILNSEKETIQCHWILPQGQSWGEKRGQDLEAGESGLCPGMAPFWLCDLGQLT